MWGWFWPPPNSALSLLGLLRALPRQKLGLLLETALYRSLIQVAWMFVIIVQLNGQALDGTSHQELAQYILQANIRDLSILVTSKTRIYAEYSKALKIIRSDVAFSAEFCEKLRKQTRKPAANPQTRHIVGVAVL